MSLSGPNDPGIGLIHVALRNPLAACVVLGAAALAYYCFPWHQGEACSGTLEKVSGVYVCVTPTPPQ